jgi:hypothetical protein
MSQKIERTGEISEDELAALKLEHPLWNSHSENTEERQDAGSVTWMTSNSLTGSPAHGGSYSTQWNAGAFIGTHPSSEPISDPLPENPPYYHFVRDTMIVIEAEVTSYYEVSAPGAYSTDYYNSIFAQRIKYRKLAVASYHMVTVRLIIEETEKIYNARPVAEELPNALKEVTPSTGRGVGDDGSYSPGDDYQGYDGSFDGLDGWEPSPLDLYPYGPSNPDEVSPRSTKLSAQWPATQSVASIKAPVPIIYGTHALGGNYLWVANPTVEQNDCDTYCVRFLIDIALCCGMVDELVSIQVEDKVHVFNKVRGVDGDDYVQVSLSDHERVTFYFGTEDQPVDSTVLSEKLVGRYLAYPFICHAVVEISITVRKEEPVKVPDMYFIVRRTPSCGLAFTHNMSGAANPVDIVFDLMTAECFEERFTMDDLDAEALLSVGTVLADEGFGLNLAYRQSMDVTQAIEAVLEHVDASMPFNGEKYILMLNRNDYVIGELELVDSNNSTRPALKRESTQNVINEVSVSINDEDTDDKAIRLGPARDVGGQETCGYRKPAHLEIPGVTNTTLGHRIMWRKLRESVYPSATLEWQSDLSFLTRLPGHKVRVTFDELEYEDRVFQLTEIKLGAFPLVSMQLTAKEDIWQWTDDSFIELGDLDKWNEGGGQWRKTGTVPVSYSELMTAGVSYPGVKVFELPYMEPGAVLDERVRLAVAVSKPSPYTAVGYYLYISTAQDQTTDYKLIAIVREFAAQGELLQGPFHAMMGPHDAFHTLGIAIDGFTMMPYCPHDIKYMHRGQRQDVIDRAQMGWVNSEWVSIRDIIRDDIDLHWRSIGVGRSWLDGEGGSEEHGVGAEVWILKRGLFLIDKDFDIGDTIYIKVVPFDLFYERDLSECTALEHVVQGIRHRPFSPINLLVRSSGRGADRVDAIGPEQSPVWDAGDNVVLYWRRRSRGIGARFEDFFRVLGDTLTHTDGTVEIDVINPATEAVVREVIDLDTDTWTYTQAMMVVDFGGEPNSVTFRVYQKDAAAGAVEALRSLHYVETTVKKV